MGKREITLRLTTESGEEVKMDVEMKPGNQQQMEYLPSKLFQDISVTVKITFDEVGQWITDKCRSLFHIPEDVEVNYEIDTRYDMTCHVRPASGRITEVSVNLTSNIFWNDDNLHTMIGEIAGIGHLIDAGFEVMDDSCIDFCDEEGWIKYSLYGDMSKVEIAQNKDCTSDDLQEPGALKNE